MNFNFITANGTLLTSSFNIVPVSYPTIYNSQIIAGECYSNSLAPINLSITDNIYKIEYNDKKTANNWFISSSNNTASYVSASVYSGSFSNVYFDLANLVNSPLSFEVVDIKPLQKNVFFNDSFVSQEAVSYTADTNGTFTASLVPQPYLVTLYSANKTKNTTFTILPSGSDCFAKDVITTTNFISSVITPANSANYGYTAQASDARYAFSNGSGSVASSSYAVTASYVPNLYPTASVSLMALTASYISPVNLSYLTTTASFDSFSASVASGKQDTLIIGGNYNITSSWAETASSVSPALINVPNGLVGLDANGNILATVIPLTGSFSNMSSVVLQAGERAYITDTGNTYIGNGVNSINQLYPQYFGTSSNYTASFNNGLIAYENVIVSGSVNLSGSIQGTDLLINDNDTLTFDAYNQIFLNQNNNANAYLSINRGNISMANADLSSLNISADVSFYANNNYTEFAEGNIFTSTNGNITLGAGGDIICNANNLLVNGNISCSVVTASLNGTASWATTASYYNDSVLSASIAVTKQDKLVTGATYNITSSWANNAITSSYIDAGNITTGTLNNSRLPSQITVTGLTASLYGTASYANTASYVNAGNVVGIVTSASHANNADTAINLSGVLPVSNGGTGITSLTSGYIPYGNGTSAFGSTSALQYSSNTITLNGVKFGSAYGTSYPNGINFSDVGSFPAIDFFIGTATYAEGFPYLRLSHDPTANALVFTGVARTTGNVGQPFIFYASGQSTEFRLGNNANIPLTFYNNSLEVMRVHTNNCVGIGTFTPVNKLDVAGNIACSVITASVHGANYIQLPYTSSGHALTPTVQTGSMYVDATNNLIYVYNGTRWTSGSLA